MSYEVLKRELKQGITRGLYLFYGPEEYLKKHYCGELEKLVVEPFAKDVSFNMFEGKPDSGALYDACNSYPLFGNRRFVVIKNSGLFKQGAGTGGRQRRGAKSAARGGKSPDKTSGTGAGEQPDDSPQNTGGIFSPDYIIDNLPEFICMLFIEDEVDKRLSLFNKVNGKGLVVEFSYRTPAELEAWVRAIAGQDGKKITKEALRHFVAFSSGSMTDLRSEIDKLLIYTTDKQGITLEDVTKICSFSLKARIFGLLDNVLSGDKKRALSELEALFYEREPAMRILSALSNHLILLRQIRGFADSGFKLSEAAKLMGLNPYRAEILWRQGARAAPRAVGQAIELCKKQDMAVKSGATDDVTALRLLIASITV